MNGYSIWGDIFKSRKMQLNRLEQAPTAKNLSSSSIYIITDPDTEKETAHPNYMQTAEVKVIANWVKEGGVLVLMANDSSNAELPHFNSLAEAFGIRFTNKVRNTVIKDISVGKIVVPAQHEIFKTAKVLYLKGISTIEVKDGAKAVIEDKGDIIMPAPNTARALYSLSEIHGSTTNTLSMTASALSSRTCKQPKN